ncbi:MAG: hypothetical protein IJK25_03535, partial [Firmicutes bacterium]|nr:hypothetical protein [Bacillota bacterium]
RLEKEGLLTLQQGRKPVASGVKINRLNWADPSAGPAFFAGIYPACIFVGIFSRVFAAVGHGPKAAKIPNFQGASRDNACYITGALIFCLRQYYPIRLTFPFPRTAPSSRSIIFSLHIWANLVFPADLKVPGKEKNCGAGSA